MSVFAEIQDHLAKHVYREARSLLDPTAGGWSGEYERGVVETVIRVLGLSHNDHTAMVRERLGLDPIIDEKAEAAGDLAVYNLLVEGLREERNRG